MGFVGVDIAFLGASSVSDKTGVPLWEANIQVGNTDDDVEPFGPTPVYQSLGITSFPWPKDESGQAEGVVIRNVGGRPAILVGARDTRFAKIVGNGKPGDTIVHSVGPNQTAQVQLKEEKLIAALISKTEGANGTTMAVILDGKNEKVQVTHAGAILEIGKEGDISLINGAGSGLLIQGGNIFVMGTLVAGAGNPPGLCFMLGPSTGSPGGAGSPPMFPCSGIAPG